MSLARFAAPLGLALIVSACQAHPVTAAPVRTAMQVGVRQAPASVSGDWVVHLYVGKQAFADQLHLVADASGALSGTLTVTGVFTAPLEKVRLVDDVLSFEILAPEGAKPFRVFYRGQVEPKATTMTGFATLADGSLMGGYVAQKQAQ
ncbi:MAG: hypothetical protein JWM80_4809 [Cyanobacteria bacterium RYN_339]|nr:hypothetical protein [Cyanobacteria bacterium RYN_339]